jgi:hypothetical protein
MLADIKGTAEGGEAEYADDARCNAEGQWLTVRKALEPGWAWNDVTIVDGFLKWKRQWGVLGWVPYYEQRRLKFRREWYGHKWSPRYEHEIDEAPPDSVLRQRHEPPTEAPPSPAPRLPPGVKVRDYWRGVKGRPLARPKWRTPCVEELPDPEARRLLFLSEAKRHWWTTLRQRPPGATYEIDLEWKTVRIDDDPFPDVPSSLGAGAYLLEVPVSGRALVGERLRSPYYPRGLWSYQSKHWVPDTPNKRPGAWAQQYVEGPAHELAAKRAELKRRREAAIDGLLSNFGY